MDASSAGTVSAPLVMQTFNFHGQQIQKLWEAEYGDNDLMRRNIIVNKDQLNFHVYNERQKTLTFQDRGKRLKLQQFIVKNAEMLYGNGPDTFYNIGEDEKPITGGSNEELYAITPPFETYLSFVDKQQRLRHFFKNVKIGDKIIGTIVSKTQSGMMLKVLCTAGTEPHILYAADMNIKAFCPIANVIPAVDKKGIIRTYMMNDSVCAEILEKIPDSDKLVCCMKGGTSSRGNISNTTSQSRPPLGLITNDDFPLVYKKALEHKNDSFETVLEKSTGFNNPNNITYLSGQLGVRGHCTNMRGLKGRFPENEYATELRQVQASKWAYRNVADGIDHFKAGKHVEAFQCLNKALNIDPRNVEGLVARGALYANSGSFQKAIGDFETALKLNPSHGNARKYMGETLVALGRSYEDEDKLEEARKAYQSCLTLLPHHEEAQNSLNFLKNKTSTGGANATKNLIEPDELLASVTGGGATSTAANNTNSGGMGVGGGKDKKKKRKKGKKHHRRGSGRHRHRSTSTTSTSSSSATNDSSTTSTSSSSDASTSSSDSETRKRSSKKRHSRHSTAKRISSNANTISSEKRENSLSPLSKRMAMMDQSSTGGQFTNKSETNLYDFNLEQQSQQQQQQQQSDETTMNAIYEQKLRTFLQETNNADSDYEEKVRKFLEESTKWKKEQHHHRGTSKEEKKKKKRKEKKAKKDSARKKKKDKKLKRKSFDLSEFDDHKKLRDAIKKELNKEKKKKHLQQQQTNDDDVDDYFLQKTGYTKRFIDCLPDLEELESKLNAYYALEKESSKRSTELNESRFLDSPSPTREQKARQTVAEATASAGGKWKMQIHGVAPSISGGTLKSAPQFTNQNVNIGLTAQNDEHYTKKAESTKQQQQQQQQLIMGRGNKLIPPPMRRTESPPPMTKKAPPPQTNVVNVPPQVPQGQVVLDKFGNFRLMSPPKKGGGDVMGAARRPPEPPGRPRSTDGSKSPKRSRYHSRSSSRSRSRSYRSRSRSYYSRSPSRSGSYSRSRSRSRSHSGDRRRYGGRRGGGGFRGGRGTYYKPRFQNPRHMMRGGRGGYRYGGGGGGDREYRGGRGRQMPLQRGGGGGNRRPLRGRFGRGGGGGGGFRRDFRSRSMSDSYSRSRSRDSSSEGGGGGASKKMSTPPNSNNRENDTTTIRKINKYEGEPAVKPDEPLSEGEDRDDYTTNKTDAEKMPSQVNNNV